MISSAKTFFLFVALITWIPDFAQVRFQVNSLNYCVIYDSVKGVSYSFDSGSEYSNLFDKGTLKHKFGGLSLIQNAQGKFKFIKKGRIKEEVPGLGTIRTNANILGNADFSKENCVPVDLLLGSRAMKKHKLHFDNERLIIKSLDTLPADIAGYRKLQLQYGFFNNDYFTWLDINGEKIKFLVDTGYSGHITVSTDENLTKPAESYDYFDLVGFTVGETTVQQHNDNTITHNGIPFVNDVVYSYASGGMNIIGNAFFLSYDDVIFDLKGKAIYLRNEGKRFDPFPDDVLFGVDSDDVFRIIYLKNSSELYRQGFRVGDAIVLQDKELVRRLRAAPCESVSILREWKAVHEMPIIFSKG